MFDIFIVFFNFLLIWQTVIMNLCIGGSKHHEVINAGRISKLLDYKTEYLQFRTSIFTYYFGSRANVQ